MEIIIDTREQLPLFTKGIRFGLMVGDYSTRLLLNSFSVERKSLQDLCGTLCQGHRRFRRQLLRAKINGIQMVMVVEGTRRDLMTKNFPGGKHRKISGETLCKIISTLEKKYNMPVHWCPSRAAAKRKITTLFKQQESLILLSKRTNNNGTQKRSNSKAKNRKDKHIPPRKAR